METRQEDGEEEETEHGLACFWRNLYLLHLFFLMPVILFFFGKKIEKVDEKINRTLRKVDENGENGVETVTVAC